MKKISIAIDHGNSRIKVSAFREGVLIYSLQLEQMNQDEILAFADNLHAYTAIYAATARKDTRLIESLNRLLPGGCLVLTSSTPLPLIIDYKSTDTLGADRIAAAVGARDILPTGNLLVIDAGTCITLDIVEGLTFRGGNIVPGINLRFKSMHEFTHALPRESLNPAGEAIPYFGRSTAEALKSGVLYGIIAEIEMTFRHAHGLFGVNHIMLTGGDAPILLPLLEKLNLPVTHCKSPVLTGLLKILTYNENI